MVNALIRIGENTNRVLNMVKARHGLRNKGEAVEFVVNEFVEYENEPELKPEFIAKIGSISKQKSIPIDDFAKRYGLS